MIGSDTIVHVLDSGDSKSYSGSVEDLFADYIVNAVNNSDGKTVTESFCDIERNVYIADYVGWTKLISIDAKPGLNARWYKLNKSLTITEDEKLLVVDKYRIVDYSPDAAWKVYRKISPLFELKTIPELLEDEDHYYELPIMNIGEDEYGFKLVPIELEFLRGKSYHKGYVIHTKVGHYNGNHIILKG